MAVGGGRRSQVTRCGKIEIGRGPTRNFLGIITAGDSTLTLLVTCKYQRFTFINRIGVEEDVAERSEDAGRCRIDTRTSEE